MLTTWGKLIDRLMYQNLENDKQNCYCKNLDLISFEEIDEPFKLCLYTNPKGKYKTLLKQYSDENSIKDVLKKLKEDSEDLIELSLKGEPKHGSNSNYKHCLTFMYINKKEKLVVVNFRNSDFIKKFPVDLFLIKDILKKLNIEDYIIYCNFEKLTLRAPFLYIYLNHVYLEYGEEMVLKYLKDKPFLVELFINYYKNNLTKNIKYKSLERCRRYMLKTEVYKYIKKYIEEDYD